MVLLFPADLYGLPNDTVPRFLAIPGSSSRKLCFPSRVRRRISPAHFPQKTSASLKVMLLITTSARRIHFLTSFPRLVYVPSSTFLTPSTAYSSSFLVGLFHPTAASRIHFPRIFPSNQPSCLIDNPFPHDISNLFLRLSFLIRSRSSCLPPGL
jgi:hypothetical protein